ncbi:hypothetical protein FHR32_001160 [Streptosporangium album]|uniref:Uncharacterized protein n=1 Tax=Streptosporangium album TaxID=47479 RepID=A0A7W7W8D2_9ACTN|nr:hypothetical protein [Streptosporangium album]MBB4936855.1 hypothetical protein [Streptosporangium album]
MSRFRHEHSLVLTDDADVAALVAHARSSGWTKTTDLPYGHYDVTQLGWQVSGETFVLYGESHGIGCRFVTVTGDEAGSVEATVAEVIGTVGTVTEEEMLVVLLADPMPPAREIIRSLHRVTAAHFMRRIKRRPPEPGDPRYVRAVTRLMNHPDRSVRRSLIIQIADLIAVRPDLAEPVLARRKAEKELVELMEVFAEIAAAQASPHSGPGA